ncbi:hypothetical protein TRICI_003672 [Trichomonascus ciferrii]|uniref:Zinc finger PHD-type domain-containing protein n=1 Tax=Trichomonascus ciferrii TaxID=44093 RepID=A0A642V9I2_9ASCO|nr:hypothetical protein TRICI_003672 [Trichomonascus ciferrii]
MKVALPLDEEGSAKSLGEIRQMWEFCLLVQFVSFFGPTLLKLSANEEPDVNQVEEELLGYSYPTQDNGEFQLLTKIEKGIVGLLLEPRFRVDFDSDLKRIYSQRYGKSRACDVDTEDLIEVDEDSGKVVGLKKTYKAMNATEKIRVLAQLVRWISVDDRFRDRIDEESPEEFRINPLGYEGEFGTYFLFDDNRLYYREEKNKRPAVENGSKKRKRGVGQSIELEEDEPRWECVCWDESSWKGFVGGGGRMMKEIRKDILPVIAEDEQTKRDSAVWRAKQREKAVLVANRKRSSRIEQRKKKAEEEEQLQRELEHQKKQRQREREQLQRERAREERFRKREELRAAQQAAQANGSEPGSGSGAQGSMTTTRSTRRAAARSWEFDCECGVHGTNYDDGELSVACDECDIWMHVRCLDQETQKQILADQNGSDDTSQFQFICSRCKRKSQTQPPANGPPTPTPTIQDNKDTQPEVPEPGNRPAL